MPGKAHSKHLDPTAGASAHESPDASGRLPLPVRRHRLVAEIDRRLRGRCGVPAGSALALGVSGGADSVALLLACVVLRDRGEGYRGRRGSAFDPFVVHVNHHLRGGADEDAEFVAGLCRGFSVPFHLRHVKPGDLAGNVEANARSLRYEALRQVAAETGAEYAAVGHVGEDQLETMLMALCRGTGLDGLSGMAWSRPLSDSVRLVRPMLAARKCDCEGLCRTAGIQWREDPSNKDIDQARARLRRDVLPVLESLWPDAPRRAGSTADLVATAQQALTERIEQSFGPPTEGEGGGSWPRAELSGLPVSIIAAGLRRAAISAAPSVADLLGQRQLLAAAEQIAGDDRSPKEHDWPGGLTLRITSKRVELTIKPPGAPPGAD